MIEDGTKVETDTSRTMTEGAFDGAWGDDDVSETPAPAEAVTEVSEGDEVPTAGGSVPAASADADPVVPEQAPPVLPEGYKLDAQGRVHGPDGRIVAKDAAEKMLAEAKAPEATKPSDAIAPAPAPAKPSPFQYRAFGETKAVEGWSENPDGSVTIAAEKANELRHLKSLEDSLGQQSDYVNQIKAENAELKQQVQRHESVQPAEVAKANALVESLTKILQNPDERAFLEEVFKLREQHPVLLAKAEADHLRSQLQSQQARTVTGKPAAPSPQDAPGLPTHEDALQATLEYVEHLKLDAQLRDVSAADWKQFSERTQRTPYAYLRRATAEDAKQYPVRVGEVVFDKAAVRADVEAIAKSIRDRKKEREAATFNARQGTPTPSPSKPKPRALAAAGAPAKPVTFDEAWNAEDDD